MPPTALSDRPLPIFRGTDGVALIGPTRVTLDTLVEAIRDGSTAEGIVSQYPVLTLADAEAVIAHVLERPADIEEYMAVRTRRREEVRAENEARHDPHGIRERLMARRMPSP